MIASMDVPRWRARRSAVSWTGSSGLLNSPSFARAQTRAASMPLRVGCSRRSRSASSSTDVFSGARPGRADGGARDLHRASRVDDPARSSRRGPTAHYARGQDGGRGGCRWKRLSQRRARPERCSYRRARDSGRDRPHGRIRSAGLLVGASSSGRGQLRPVVRPHPLAFLAAPSDELHTPAHGAMSAG